MPASSNSLFFAVTAVPPLDEVGWEVRVLDHRDFSTVVAVINEYVELTIGPELCAPGNGSITLDAGSPFWATTLPNGQPAGSLRDYEYLFEAYEDGQLRFQFLGTVVEEHLLEDDETQAITISGPGAAQVLAWACVLPPGFPSPPREGALTTRPGGYNWQFPYSWPAMKMWLTLLRASQSRGTIPWVQPMFTDTKDSGGAVWEVIQTQESAGALPGDGHRPDPGTNLLDLLNIHTGQDLDTLFAMRAEWFMWPGFKLDVRKVIGTHREQQVIFFEGGIQQKERTRSREEIANYIVTVDVNGATSLASNSESISNWNKREQLQNHNGNITDPARRNAISQVFLEQKKDESVEWVITVPYDQTGRKVFADYNIGDWIGINSYAPDGTTAVEPYRVMAIVVHITSNTPTLELTLQSRFQLKQRQLQDRLTRLINAVGGGGIGDRPDVDIPYLPNVPAPIQWDPGNQRFGLGDYGAIGDAYGWGSGGIQVFVQADDPATPEGGSHTVNTGDLWYQTA